ALGLPALAAFAVFASFQLPIATVLTLAAAPFYLPNESNPLGPKAFGTAQFTLVEALTLALFAGFVLRDTVDWLRSRRPPAWVDWAFSRVDRLALIGALGL